MPANPDSLGPKCPRCRTHLGPGVNYCVGCGCSVESDPAARKAGVEFDLMRRREKMENQRFAARFLRFFWWFPW
jgi:hypothetical protein